MANSLVAGTLVHTEEGLVPIEWVKVGEKVLSWDERTGETSYQPVLELIQHEGMYELVRVTLESGEQLEATAGHPFYVQGKGWNAAAGLKVGDALLLYNGTTLVVKTVDSRVGWERVYNFSVAGNANYFVGFGGVGVHNCGKLIFEKKIKKQMSKRGWDEKSIEDTVSKPHRTVATKDDRWQKNGTQRNDPATAYIREDGSYVVINDVDGTIVQISDRKYPNWITPF